MHLYMSDLLHIAEQHYIWAESCYRQIEQANPRNFWCLSLYQSQYKPNICKKMLFYSKQNILLIKGQKVIVVCFKSYLGE